MDKDCKRAKKLLGKVGRGLRGLDVIGMYYTLKNGELEIRLKRKI